MWLAVCMPAVSQYLAARHADVDAAIYSVYCTTAADHEIGPASDHALSAPLKSLPAGDHAQACGYCTLLANHPPLIHVAPVVVPSFAWIARAGPVVVPPTPFSRTELPPPARAPPQLA